MIVAGYSLVLYCDGPHEPWEYTHGTNGSVGEATGETYRECAQILRKLGWTLMPSTGQCFCKLHKKVARQRAREVAAAIESRL